MGWHSHGWGTYHSHRVDLVTDNRPKLAVLLALGIAGGILPDPAALAILLAALASGKVMLGWRRSWCSAWASPRPWWWSG